MMGEAFPKRSLLVVFLLVLVLVLFTTLRHCPEEPVPAPDSVAIHHPLSTIH
jgi:hypothetical protein